MPQVNLTAVTGQELRQLLDASRRRGDAALSYKILQEMAARRDGAAARRSARARRAAEPQLVSVDLGEPAEEEDDVPPMPNWRPPPREPEESASSKPRPAPRPARRPSRPKAHPAPPPAVATPAAALEAEPPQAPETDRPLSFGDDDLQAPTGDWADVPDQDLQMHAQGRGRGRAAGRPRLRSLVSFALGIVLGIGLGWWGGRIARDVLAPPAAPASAPIQTAALTPGPAAVPTPPPASAVEPAPEAPPAPAAALPLPDVSEAATSTPDASAVVPDAEPAPAAAPPPAVLAGGCAARPTPADREICADPKLQRLQGELRRAYAKALDAHQDRTLLRQRQLAWRDARNSVADPARLARLYEERIRKLNAATAAARQRR